MKPESTIDERRPTMMESDTFIETALRLSGKGDEETRKTVQLDAADDQLEMLFKPQYQTASSPIHRAVWERTVPVDLFIPSVKEPSPLVRRVVDDSLSVARRHRDQGTRYDEQGKINQRLIDELGTAGWWGLLVSEEYGGAGASIGAFCRALRQMIVFEPTLAGMNSVHAGVGAIDPLRTFGTLAQKQALLPKLARGERLSGFALTEPWAGSDLTALRTHAELEGDHFVLTGEKLFITSAVPGRTIAVVALVEGRPAVLIVDLPTEENEQFQLVRYGLHALKRTYNNGLKFNGLRVPRENLIIPPRGDGLMVAYHGLNNGRVALCAMAGGGLRNMLANMIPWAGFRRTYGMPIVSRELVQRRLGRCAGMIAACDALVDWCSWLLEQGYRGEMECVIAKIFSSESQKDAALEFFMKTHGGRAFLHGHAFGDNVHDMLAPCIYEGEGEMLAMAFFKSLIKEHGRQFFEPIGKTLLSNGISKPNMNNPAHLWALRKPIGSYLRWYLAEKLRRPASTVPDRLPAPFRAHVQLACSLLQQSKLDISDTMRKHQLSLADRQCRMAELSQRVQDMVTLLVTALYGGRHLDELTRSAADVLCQDITRKLTGSRPSDKYYKEVTRLGEAISDGGFEAIAGVPLDDILMSYPQ